MGENKGHGDKSPNYPELDQQGSAANRAGSQQGQQDIGNQQSGNQQSDYQGSGRQQSGNLQSGNQQQGKQQDMNNQQNLGSQQSGRQQDVSNQQSGQRQNQQKGGQHASGGTPALDDLEDSDKGSIGNAQNQQGDWNSQQDKKR